MWEISILWQDGDKTIEIFVCTRRVVSAAQGLAIASAITRNDLISETATRISVVMEKK